LDLPKIVEIEYGMQTTPMCQSACEYNGADAKPGINQGRSKYSGRPISRRVDLLLTSVGLTTSFGHETYEDTDLTAATG